MDDDILDELCQDIGRAVVQIVIEAFRDWLDEHGEDLMAAVKAQLYEGIRDAAREEIEAAIKSNLLLIQTAFGGTTREAKK